MRNAVITPESVSTKTDAIGGISKALFTPNDGHVRKSPQARRKTGSERYAERFGIKASTVFPPGKFTEAAHL